jgi:lysophospholipase L1-like esterase
MANSGRRRSRGARCVAFVVSVVLVLTGTANPSAAAAAAPPCATHGSSFAKGPFDDLGVLFRLGCASDAGTLRSMAGSDDDVVAAVDFDSSQHPAQWQQVMSQEVDAIHAEQGRGLTLSQAFRVQSQKRNPGLYQAPANDVRFGGTISVVGSSIVIVVPAADITASGFWDGFWKKSVSLLAGTAAMVAVGAGCIRIVPEFIKTCGAIAGAVAGFTDSAVEALVNNEPWDGKLAGQLLAASIFGAIAGGTAGVIIEKVLLGSSVVFTTMSKVLRTLAGTFRSFRGSLNYLADMCADGSTMFQGFREAISRMQNGVGTTDVPLRVMPLGDSITHGAGSLMGAGYRVPLHEYMTRSGGRVEFVGSQQSGPAPSAHEGHPGWLIGDIATIAGSAMATYRPNVVLLQIGTNDMNGNVDPAGAPARLGDLIDRILGAVPGVTLVVSTIVPSTIPATQERIVRYNQAIPGVVATRRAAGKHVALADLGAVTTVDLADFLHPNDAGYRKMATAFFRGVLSTGDAGWIVPPTGGSGVGSPPRGWLSQGVIATGTMSRGSAPGSLALSTDDQVQFADVNGDRKADYLVNHRDGSVSVWEHGGAGPDGAVIWTSRGTSGPYSFNALWQFADFDADGKADLFQINRDSGAVGVFWNNGLDEQGRYRWDNVGRVFPSTGTSPATPGSQIRIADVNGDNKADYLVVNADSSVRAWLAVGWGASEYVWWSQGVIATGVGSPSSQIRFADLNDDAKADYLDVAPNGSVKAWINGAPTWTWPILPDNMPWHPQGVVAAGVGSPDSQIRFADLDGDGDDEYLVVDPVNGSVREWRNFGGQAQTGGWYWDPRGVITTGNPDRVVYADLNGDHRADYLVVKADSSVQAWLNGGAQAGEWPWYPQGTIASGVGAPGSQIRFADINGDSRADYLSVNPDSSVQAWTNAGANGTGFGWYPQGTIASGVGVPGNQVRFADLTGDGRADYIDVAPTSAVQFWVNGNAGSGSWPWYPQGTTATGVGVPGNRIQFADLTGDGRADYIDVDPATGATKAWLNVA